MSSNCILRSCLTSSSDWILYMTSGNLLLWVMSATYIWSLGLTFCARHDCRFHITGHCSQYLRPPAPMPCVSPFKCCPIVSAICLWSFQLSHVRVFTLTARTSVAIYLCFLRNHYKHALKHAKYLCVSSQIVIKHATWLCVLSQIVIKHATWLCVLSQIVIKHAIWLCASKDLGYSYIHS